MAAPAGYADEFKAISAILKTGWKATPILWPGIVAEPPRDERGRPVSYVRFFIINAASTQASTGSPSSNVFRHPGQAVCKIYAEPGLGEIEAKELADKCCAIFRNKNSVGIRFSAPYSVILGQTEDGYYQINCFAPFERDSLL